MLDMNAIGWIVVGGFAGWISAALIGARTARGCFPNILVGVLGGLLGGWLATAMGFATCLPPRNGQMPKGCSRPARAANSDPGLPSGHD